MANVEELLAEAKAKGIEVPEGATKKEIQSVLDAAAPVEGESAGEGEVDELTEEEAQAAIAEQKQLEADAKKPVVKSEGSEIAAAIVQGLKDSKEDKRIRITSDKSVISRFSVVRSKQTGEILLRENSNGVLSRVQLQSIEEKEASIQGQEVEEV